MKKTTEQGVTVLTADDGMMLTDNYSVGTTVRLGKEDDGAVWHEITVEEAEKMMTEDTATETDYRSALREFGVSV